MTKEEFLSLNSRIDDGIETMKKDGFTWPVLLLEDCKKALRELYIENLKLEVRVCVLRIPGLIITHTDESEKTLKETILRAKTIREELRTLGVA